MFSKCERCGGFVIRGLDEARCVNCSHVPGHRARVPTDDDKAMLRRQSKDSYLYRYLERHENPLLD